jgi:hypothetical protein
MLNTFRHLDLLLRGQTTRLATLRSHGIRVPAISMTSLLIMLGACYGVCMGVFALTLDNPQWQQMLANSVKVPALFVLTLLVTLPSLYVFNALVGSRLAYGPLVRLMVASQAITLTVLASLGPIVAFFSFSTNSYAFIVVLNVVVFAIAGLLGLLFLRQTLHRLSIVESETSLAESAAAMDASIKACENGPHDRESDVETEKLDTLDGGAEPIGTTDPLERRSAETPTAATSEFGLRTTLEPIDPTFGPRTKFIFAIWMAVFGLVGSQMAWILRPFIGSPGKDFTWFRPRGSNFFEAVWAQLRYLMGL